MTTGWTCGPGRPPHKSGGRGGEEGGKGGGGKNRRWKFELQLAAGSEDVAQEKKTEGFLFTFTFRDLFLPLVFCPDVLFMKK